MISNGYQALQSYPHLTLLSEILLVFTIMSFNFLGDGLRDALDPKMK
jgi:ABC-type dipeptide/oligopeptide/nickel transport system permease subunit